MREAVVNALMQDFSAPMYNRNPKLQFAFGGTKLVEGRGFGMRTFGEAAGEHSLPVPKYAFDGLYLNLTIYRDPKAAVEALRPDVLKALNEDDEAAWMFISGRQAVSSSELVVQMGFDARKAQRVLKKLQDAGLLRRVGRGPATHYELLQS